MRRERVYRNKRKEKIQERHQERGFSVIQKRERLLKEERRAA